MKILKSILFILLLVSFGYSANNQITIKTIDGKKLTIQKEKKGLKFLDFKDKVVLLEFYGDSCPHCLSAIDSYNKLQQKYKDKVAVVALELYGRLNNAHKQKYITVSKKESLKVLKPIKKLTGYSGGIVPYLIILDKNGEIKYHQVLPDMNDVEKLIILLNKSSL